MPYEPIAYIEKMPVVAIDAEGVTLLACSGERVFRRRFPRSLWRRFLETEIRRINQWEVAERAERGCVVPFTKATGEH